MGRLPLADSGENCEVVHERDHLCYQHWSLRSASILLETRDFCCSGSWVLALGWPEPTLLRINWEKGILLLTWTLFLSSSLAWNNSVINLSLFLVYYFFIGLLRDIILYILACEIIIIPQWTVLDKMLIKTISASEHNCHEMKNIGST